MRVFRPDRWLFALAVLIVVLAASPASAQTCKVTNAPAFATTKMDIVSGKETYTASTEIGYECSAIGPVGSVATIGVQICAYILKDAGMSPASKTDTFYQTGDGNSRLAFNAQFEPGLAPNGQSTVTGSAGKLTLDGSGKLNGSLRLRVTHLGRQQQDRIRSGTYGGEYRIVSNYRFNAAEVPCPQDPLSAGETTIFTLPTTIQPTCQLENKGEKQDTFDPIDFGTRGALSAANAGAGAIRATTNIDVRCTYETPYTLDLDNGKNFDGGTRRMKNGDNFLAYQLFNKTASGESSPWSKLSGIGNTVNAVNKHTVEGQLTTPIAIAPAAGAYADTVVMTLTF